MGIKIITTHSNGAKNIDLSRQETNKDNLVEAKLLWEEIVEIDETNFLEYADFTSEDEDLEQLVTSTIPNRIKKNFLHYDLKSPDDISWKEIKETAQAYLDADKIIQINFCKDSTRQTVDERVQRHMLNEELPNWVFKKCKPVKYVYDGKLLDKKTYLKLDKQRTRKDIDTLGESENKNIWIFQKYAKVTGGHQDNVLTETKHFLMDAAIYTSNNNDHNYFIAQLDGKFIESHIKDLNDNIKGSSNVYAGNTEEVIDWIKNI